MFCCVKVVLSQTTFWLSDMSWSDQMNQDVICDYNQMGFRVFFNSFTKIKKKWEQRSPKYCVKCALILEIPFDRKCVVDGTVKPMQDQVKLNIFQYLPDIPECGFVPVYAVYKAFHCTSFLPNSNLFSCPRHSCWPKCLLTSKIVTEKNNAFQPVRL